MRPGWFDLRGMLESQIERAREAALRGVQFELVADGAPERYWGDEALLRQALSNLISNAEQAMPGGGRVTVSVESSDDRVSLAVSDQGIGIPEDVQSRVFDIHFTTKEGGSGIGLAVVQQVVKMHGGQVRLRSKAGEGTTIALDLPAHARERLGVA